MKKCTHISSSLNDSLSCVTRVVNVLTTLGIIHKDENSIYRVKLPIQDIRVYHHAIQVDQQFDESISARSYCLITQ